VIVLLGSAGAVGATAFYFGDSHALKNLTVRRVSADSVASAMHRDEFYSDFRENTLLVTGSVAAISDQYSRQTIQFTTSGNFKTLCLLKSKHSDLDVGDRITVVTEAYAAVRRPSAVLLENCVVLLARRS
jgi:hypothetical protein